MATELGWNSWIWGVLLCCTSSSYVIWCAEADRRLGTKIAAIRAAGEPLRPADFRRERPPMERNAAPALVDLLATSLAEHSFSKDDVPDWLRDRSLFLRQQDGGFAPIDGIAEIAPAFEQACALPECDWGTQFRSPLIKTLRPYGGDQRRLALALNALAREEACRGRFAEAVGLIDALLRHSAFIGSAPGLLMMLLEVSVEQAALETLRGLALDVGRMDPPTRGRLRQITRRLADESDVFHHARAAMHYERALVFDVVVADPSQLRQELGPVSFLGESALLSPLRKFDAMSAMACFEQCSAALEAPTREAASRLAPRNPFRGWSALPHFYSAVLLPNFNSAIERHHDRLALRRRVSREIAAQLFEADHGRPPGTIEELVPDYLSRLNPEPTGGW